MLLRLAQPPDLCGSQRLWLEHTMHMLGFEPGPLRLCNVPMSLARGRDGAGGPCSPASCLGTTKERDGCSCWLFITVLKLP